MPYITPKQREIYDNLILKLYIELSDNNIPTGDINYIITRFLHYVLDDIRQRYDSNYSGINEIIGVLECAKMELYRAIAGPYEEKKRRENGPISTLDSLSLEDVR